MVVKIKFDSEKIKAWYNRHDIYLLITTYNDFKYLTFMAYDENTGKSIAPRRFQTMAKSQYGYNYVLKYNSVGRTPVSFYRDTDSWRTSRPFFSLKKEVYTKQREMFFKNDEFKKHIFGTDFVIDIDGENVYDSWDIAYRTIELLRRFGVMFCIYCSGNKGYQILIPHHKAIKKEEIQMEDGDVQNTHFLFAYTLKKYLNDYNGPEDQGKICFSMYSDLRFYKQYYSLDGRNMCPIVPLKYEEFLDFYNYKDKDYNPYMDIDYWMKEPNFLVRGMCWQGKNNMTELDRFLDKWVEEVSY